MEDVAGFHISHKYGIPPRKSIACDLRTVLDPLTEGAVIDNSETFRQVLGGLEAFLPHVLREIHPEWNESLDGILPAAARKVGPGRAQLVGACILISDQTVIPIRIDMQVATAIDEISWLECRLGERVNGEMKRIPYNKGWLKTALRADNIDAIDWYYSVTFGDKPLSQ